MHQTGTLAPSLSKREYTDNEKIVLGYFFTNTDKNIYCATSNMSSQLWAFLTGQYSRSSTSMRDRLLQLFTDMEKAMLAGKLPAKEYISVDDFAENIKQSEANPTLALFDKKASDFLEKWGVKYGHNSLKDNDVVRVIVEGVSQVFTKVIEAPFPALGAFQEKSTRYMNFSADSLIIPPELEGTEDGEKLKYLQERLLEFYTTSLAETTVILQHEGLLQKDDEINDAAYGRALQAKAFDMLRYALPTSITTALGATLSTRTLESHLSGMLAHPLAEVRLIATSIHQEALKVTPGLLKFVTPNEYEHSRRINIEGVARNFLGNEVLPMYHGIKDEERVTLIKIDPEIDNTVLASCLYQHAREVSASFGACMKQVKQMTLDEKRDLMRKTLGTRDKYDRFPREIQHGSVLVEFVCDFGAYRDIQRHRASNQLWQGATGLIGYDYPEYFEHKAFSKMKKHYDELMTEATEFARYIATKYNSYVAEYVTCLGHLIRTTFEMNPGQIAYVIELRTTPQGHQSYRRLFQELARQIKPHVPLLMEYIRINENLEASRIAEEKAAAQALKANSH